MGAIGWLVDGAAIINQVPCVIPLLALMQEPWFEFVKKRAFIKGKGLRSMLKLCNGSKEQKDMAQDALNRWWWP